MRGLNPDTGFCQCLFNISLKKGACQLCFIAPLNLRAFGAALLIVQQPLQA